MNSAGINDLHRKSHPSVLNDLLPGESEMRQIFLAAGFEVELLTDDGLWVPADRNSRCLSRASEDSFPAIYEKTQPSVLHRSDLFLAPFDRTSQHREILQLIHSRPQIPAWINPAQPQRLRSSINSGSIWLCHIMQNNPCHVLRYLVTCY